MLSPPAHFANGPMAFFYKQKASGKVVDEFAPQTLAVAIYRLKGQHNTL